MCINSEFISLTKQPLHLANEISLLLLPYVTLYHLSCTFTTLHYIDLADTVIQSDL